MRISDWSSDVCSFDLSFSVVICGRTAEKLDAVVDFARGKGATMLAMPTNVREPEQVDALFQRIHAECGRLDFTVNNAGGQFPQSAIDYAPKGWAAVINNNLNGSRSEEHTSELQSLIPTSYAVFCLK